MKKDWGCFGFLVEFKIIVNQFSIISTQLGDNLYFWEMITRREE